MAARALARAAAEKASAAARLGPSLLCRAPQSMLRRDRPCTRALLPTTKLTPRALPISPRVAQLLPHPLMRMPPLLPMAMRTGAAFSTRRQSKEAVCATDAGGSRKQLASIVSEGLSGTVEADADDLSGTVEADATAGVDAERPDGSKMIASIADDADDLSGNVEAEATAGVDAERPGGSKKIASIAEDADAAAGGDADRPGGSNKIASITEDAEAERPPVTNQELLRQLTIFIEKSERQDLKSQVARRNQTWIILAGVFCEIVVVMFGTIIFAGPFIYEYIKKKVHEAIREDATRQSIWHTMDTVFSYFGNKIASPVNMVVCGVVVAGRHLRKVAVWLYLMEEEEVIIDDKAEGSSDKGSNLKGLVDDVDEIVMKMGKAGGKGLAFGIMCGVLSSLLYDGPQVGSNVKFPQLIRTSKLCGHFGAYIAVSGATFVGVEQALTRYRMKEDFINGVAAGFAAGAVFGFRVRSFWTTFLSGSALALTSVLLYVTGMRTTDEEEKGNH